LLTIASSASCNVAFGCSVGGNRSDVSGAGLLIEVSEVLVISIVLGVVSIGLSAGGSFTSGPVGAAVEAVALFAAAVVSLPVEPVRMYSGDAG